MKLVICDDELQQLTAAKKLIEEISAKYCVPVKVQAFTDLQDCWQQLEQEPADIIILDIFMGEDLGTDFALKLRQRYGDAFALVFLTGSNEMIFFTSWINPISSIRSASSRTKIST